MHPLGKKVYLLKRYSPSDSFCTFFSESDSVHPLTGLTVNTVLLSSWALSSFLFFYSMFSILKPSFKPPLKWTAISVIEKSGKFLSF